MERKRTVADIRNAIRQVISHERKLGLDIRATDNALDFKNAPQCFFKTVDDLEVKDWLFLTAQLYDFLCPDGSRMKNIDYVLVVCI